MVTKRSFLIFSLFDALHGNSSEGHWSSCQVSLCKNSKNVWKTVGSWRQLWFIRRCLFHPLLPRARSSPFSANKEVRFLTICQGGRHTKLTRDSVSDLELTQTFCFLFSHLQAGMQPWTRDVQRARGMQVSCPRHVCYFVQRTLQLSADVKYAPVWMEHPPPKYPSSLMRKTVVTHQSDEVLKDAGAGCW